MAHSSELRWGQASAKASQIAKDLVDTILASEESYQELLEAFNYAGATDIGFAELLFRGTTGGVSVPSVVEIAMAADLRAAMAEAHSIFLAMDPAPLRRMS